MFAGNFVLIGPRASGKSTVGRALAEALGVAFVDLDDELGRRAGMSASEVLEREGEPAFREREREVLVWAAGLAEHVIATGGGAVLHGDVFERLGRTGTVVALLPDLATLVGRQKHEPRPALRDGGLEAEVAALLAEREPAYRAAAEIIIAGDLGVSILDRLHLAVRPGGHGTIEQSH